MSRKFFTPIVLPADPAAAMEAATKQYVDGKPGLPTDNAFAGRTLRRNPSTNVAEWTTNYGWMPYTAIAAGVTPDWTQFSVDNLAAPTQFKIYSSTYDQSRVADLRSLQVGDVITLVHMTSTSVSHRLRVTGTPVYAAFVLTVPVALVPETATGWGAPPSIAVGGNYAVHLTYAGGGGGGGTDEVWIGPDQPTDPALELWYDTDDTASGAGLWNTAWGVVAANAVANGVIAASAVTLATQVFTAVAGRRYALRVLNSASYTEATATGDTFRIGVQVDGVVIHNLNLSVDAVNNYFPPSSTIIDLEPTAGAHTITLVGTRLTGTGNMTARMALAVEDVGPVTASATVAPTPIMQWNSAWGLVASQIFNTETTIAGTANGNPGPSVTWTAVAGRQYRVSFSASRVLVAVAGQLSVYWADGAGNAYEHMNFTIHPANTEVVVNGFLDRAYTAGATTVRLVAGDSGGSHTWQYGGYNSRISVEDVGPVSGAVAIESPTPPWVDLTLSNGWAHYAAGRGVQIRKIGDVVQMRGVASGAAATTQGIATLPAGYAPTSDRYSFIEHGALGGGTVTPTVLNVTPGGVVSTAGAVPMTYIYMVAEWSTT